MRALLFAAGYVCDAYILLTFAGMQRAVRGRRHSLRVYNYANMLSAPVLMTVEVVTGAWPVLPLTAAFGVIAFWGLTRA